MDRSKILEQAGLGSEQISKHKKTFTNFEILVPVAYQDVFMPHVITKTPNDGLWVCKHDNISKVRGVYKDLTENFDREVCDLEFKCDPDNLYLFVINLLGPGYSKTSKFRYVGMVEVHEGIIQVVWLHPFLRGKGFMKHFFFWYATHENVLAVQPPLSKAIQCCMGSVNKMVMESPEFLTKYAELQKKWLKKKSPKSRIDELTVTEVFKVRDALTASCAMTARGGPEMPVDKIIHMSTEMLLLIREDPDAAKEITEYFKLRPEMAEEVSHTMKDFMNYGTLPKPTV